MKNSVIKDIFNGVKGNCEIISLKKSNKENLAKVSESYDNLIKHFNDKQIKRIKKFLDVYDKSNCDEMELYFTEGFKLGLLIGFECFEDN